MSFRLNFVQLEHEPLSSALILLFHPDVLLAHYSFHSLFFFLNKKKKQIEHGSNSFSDSDSEYKSTFPTRWCCVIKLITPSNFLRNPSVSLPPSPLPSLYSFLTRPPLSYRFICSRPFDHPVQPPPNGYKNANASFLLLPRPLRFRPQTLPHRPPAARTARIQGRRGLVHTLQWALRAPSYRTTLPQPRQLDSVARIRSGKRWKRQVVGRRARVVGWTDGKRAPARHQCPSE
jgi:hypothetical protein